MIRIFTALLIGLSTPCLAMMSQTQTMPKPWYASIDGTLVKKVKDDYGVTIPQGIYFEDQRKAWYRDDVTKESLIHFSAFESTEFGEGLSYLGFAERTYDGDAELWLIKPTQEKFRLAVSNRKERT